MSFADLERGLNQPLPLRLATDTSISPESDLSFKRLTKLLSLHIHKINSNSNAISKSVDLLGTNRDTKDLRNKLHQLTEVTREVVKGSAGDLKEFIGLELSPDDRQHKFISSKLISDYKSSVQSFQLIQSRSVERQKLFVDKQPITNSSSSSRGGFVGGYRDDDDDLGSGRQDQQVELSPRHQTQMQQQSQDLSSTDLDFQETLISERESEIEQIEQGITELNQIFRDIGELVEGQGGFVDTIETNIYSTTRDTAAAASQLTEAHTTQQRAARRSFYLLLVFLVVLSVVMLAVLS